MTTLPKMLDHLLKNRIDISMITLVTIFKCNERPVVTANNCYKQTVVRHGTALKNLSTGKKYRYKS